MNVCLFRGDMEAGFSEFMFDPSRLEVSVMVIEFCERFFIISRVICVLVSRALSGLCSSDAIMFCEVSAGGCIDTGDGSVAVCELSWLLDNWSSWSSFSGMKSWLA